MLRLPPTVLGVLEDLQPKIFNWKFDGVRVCTGRTWRPLWIIVRFYWEYASSACGIGIKNEVAHPVILDRHLLLQSKAAWKKTALDPNLPYRTFPRNVVDLPICISLPAEILRESIRGID